MLAEDFAASRKIRQELNPIQIGASYTVERSYVQKCKSGVGNHWLFAKSHIESSTHTYPHGVFSQKSFANTTKNAVLAAFSARQAETRKGRPQPKGLLTALRNKIADLCADPRTIETLHAEVFVHEALGGRNRQPGAEGKRFFFYAFGRYERRDLGQWTKRRANHIFVGNNGSFSAVAI